MRRILSKGVIILLFYKNMNPKIYLFIKNNSKVYKTKFGMGVHVIGKY